jgi:Holliday junction resolvase RusA-like endonuclease
MEIIEIDIIPKPKVRMVKSDAWKKRPIVLQYWEYKDELVLKCNKAGIIMGDVLGISFVLPMAKSWSKDKKEEFNGMPHQQKPDLDNLIKAVKDCLCKEDSNVWKYSPPPYKVWGETGKVIFYYE